MNFIEYSDSEELDGLTQDQSKEVQDLCTTVLCLDVVERLMNLNIELFMFQIMPSFSAYKIDEKAFCMPLLKWIYLPEELFGNIYKIHKKNTHTEGERSQGEMDSIEEYLDSEEFDGPAQSDSFRAALTNVTNRHRQQQQNLERRTADQQRVKQIVHSSYAFHRAAINSADLPTATTGSATAPEEINPTESATISLDTQLVNEPTAATIPLDTQLVNEPTATGTESSQDKLKSIIQLAPAPLAVAAFSSALLGFAPQSESIKPYLIFPYNAFFVMVWLSIVTSGGLTIYIFCKSTPSQNFAWFYNRLMIIATGSFLIAVMLWLLLKLSLIKMLYDGLCFVVIVIGIILYFWSSWRKANNSSQTEAGSAILLHIDIV